MTGFTKEYYAVYLKENILPSIYKDYLESEKVEETLDKEFEYIQSRMTNLQYAENYRKRCFIEGTTLTDYLAKEFTFGNIHIVCSIRFMGMDIVKPFVSIEYYNFSNEEFVNQFEKIKLFIYDTYQKFNPQFIHLVLKTEDECLLKNLRYEVDRLYYSATLDSIYQFQFPPNTPSFTIEKIDGLTKEEYEIYTQEYEKYCQLNPNINSIHAEPLNTINKLCKTNLGFKIYVNNEWAGIQLYAPHVEYFFYGYLVWDKIIFEKYRDLKLSAYAQNRAFQDFIPKQNGFLFGQIDSLNKPSIYTAKRSGRENHLNTYKLF